MKKSLVLCVSAFLSTGAFAQNIVVPPSLPQNLTVVEVPGGAYQNNLAFCNPIDGLIVWVAQGGPQVDGPKLAPQKRVSEATVIAPFSYCLTPDCNCFAYKKDSQGKDIPGSRYRKKNPGGGVNASSWSSSKTSGWSITGGVSGGGVSGSGNYSQSSTTSVTATIRAFSVEETSVVCGRVRVIQVPLVKDTIRQFQVARRGACFPTSTFVGTVTTDPLALEEVAYYSVDKYHFQAVQNRHIPCAQARREGLI